jgi:phosphoglycolate phosphatase
MDLGDQRADARCPVGAAANELRLAALDVELEQVGVLEPGRVERVVDGEAFHRPIRVHTRSRQAPMFALRHHDPAALPGQRGVDRPGPGDVAAQVLLEQPERVPRGLDAAEARGREPSGEVDRRQPNVRAGVEDSLHAAQEREVDAVGVAAEDLKDGNVVRAQAQPGEAADVDVDLANAAEGDHAAEPGAQPGLEVQAGVDPRKRDPIAPRRAAADQSQLAGKGLKHPELDATLPPVRTVLFWDIDGTLLSTARAGIFAVQEAVTEISEAACDMDGVPTSGLTDYEVMELALRTAGASAEPAIVGAVLTEYERRLPDALHRRRGRVLPGVQAILDNVARRDDILTLLLTGNTSAGARAKLAHYGLSAYFEDGAFCTGPGSREAIAHHAAALAERKMSATPPPGSLVVVGDTPQDIRCGRAIGARTVAVATGSHSNRELARHGPWVVCDELPSPREFQSLVLESRQHDAPNRRARSPRGVRH